MKKLYHSSSLAGAVFLTATLIPGLNLHSQEAPPVSSEPGLTHAPAVAKVPPAAPLSVPDAWASAQAKRQAALKASATLLPIAKDAERARTAAQQAAARATVLGREATGVREMFGRVFDLKTSKGTISNSTLQHISRDADHLESVAATARQRANELNREAYGCEQIATRVEALAIAAWAEVDRAGEAVWLAIAARDRAATEALLARRSPSPAQRIPVEMPSQPQTREEKLQALLQAYKADLVTAMQYQEQRARILAQPEWASARVAADQADAATPSTGREHRE